MVSHLIIIVLLFLVLRKGNRIMAKFEDLNEDLDDISAKVVEIADEIKALKEAGVSVVTQEQLDALDAKAEAIKSALDSAK